MNDDLTKRRAAELLFELARERRSCMDDRGLAQAFSDKLIETVFELAWEHQWERTSDAFLREVRIVVADAVERAVSHVED